MSRKGLTVGALDLVAFGANRTLRLAIRGPADDQDDLVSHRAVYFCKLVRSPFPNPWTIYFVNYWPRYNIRRHYDQRLKLKRIVARWEASRMHDVGCRDGKRWKRHLACTWRYLKREAERLRDTCLGENAARKLDPFRRYMAFVRRSMNFKGGPHE